MIWDLVIAYFGVTLAIAGWNVGFFNCWPTPFAMIFATVAAQMFYPNTSSWLIEQTRLPGDSGAFFAYLLLWLALEFLFELLLMSVINKFKRDGIQKWERISGACIGLGKSVVAMLFATTIALHSDNMPEPPSYNQLTLWMVHSATASMLLKDYRYMSAKLPSSLKNNVISQAAPSYEPTFKNEEDENVSLCESQQRVRSLVKAIHQFHRDLQELGQ